ncbi:MAG: peptidylprolyl isomerase [Andreesenia angusta]|nr:peptidylprolyl isomerase [Andreesenia angusta]
MDKKVFAVVGDKEITKRDVEEFLHNIGPQNAAQFQGEEGNKRVVDELVNHELMFLDAKENGLDQDDIYIKEVKRMQDNLLKQYAIQKLLSDVKVDDQEVKDFYEKNKSFIAQPEKMRASHILVETEEKAKEIIKSIEDGASFEEKAKEFSTCPSKENGGDLGEFPKGSMVPEFEAAASSMEIGEISKEPVKTQFGYHLIKLVDKKEAYTPDFEEVKDQVKEQALLAKQEKVYFEKLNELKEKYDIDYK